MALISRLGVVLGLDAGEFNAGLGKAQDGLKEFAKASLGVKLGLAGLVVGFAEFAKSSMEFADHIADIAKANDMAVSTVLALNEAMVENGGNAEAASRMMSGFAKQVDAAATGSDKNREMFQKLGVSLKDLKDLSIDDLLLKTLKGLNDVESSTKRNAEAQALFGRAIRGVDIKGLYEDMDKLKDKNKEAAQAFMETKASMDAVAGVMAQAKTDFIETFAPAIEGLTKLFLDLSYAIHSAFRAGKDLLTLNFKDLKTYDFAGVQFEKDLNARFEKARAASLLMQQSSGGGRDVAALGEEAKKQTDELQRQVLTWKEEAQNVGLVKSEYEKLRAQEEAGGKYAKASLEEKKKAEEAALAVDQARQNAAFTAQAKIYDKETDRLQLEAQMAGMSDRQQKILLDQLDAETKIRDMVEKKVITETQGALLMQKFLDQQKQEQSTYEAQRTFSAGWDKAFNDYMEKASNAAEIGKQSFQTMADAMGNAIDQFVKTGKISFRSLIGDMISQLIRLQLQAQLSGIFKMLGGAFGMGSSAGGYAGGSTYTPGFSSLASAPYPQFADGGSISGPSIVGERGPELFVPSGSGTIIPNNQLSSVMGNQAQVVYNGPYINNMSAIDTQSATQFLAKNKQGVWAANQSAQLSLPQSR